LKDASKRIDAAKQMIKGAGGEMKAFYIAQDHRVARLIIVQDDRFWSRTRRGGARSLRSSRRRYERGDDPARHESGDRRAPAA
jgi:hypothetical protein